jgi:hypothetical protein
MAKRKATKTKLLPAAKGARRLAAPAALLDDVRDLIQQAQTATAHAVNAALVMLYWQIGERIRVEVLKEKRAEYGQEILSTLSKELTTEFGNGYSWPNLSRMMRFAEVFPSQQIVATLSRRLGWSHFVEIIPLKNDLQRDFYVVTSRCSLLRPTIRRFLARSSFSPGQSRARPTGNPRRFGSLPPTLPTFTSPIRGALTFQTNSCSTNRSTGKLITFAGPRRMA